MLPNFKFLTLLLTVAFMLLLRFEYKILHEADTIIYQQYRHKNKRGKVVIQSYTHITMKDLPDINDDMILQKENFYGQGKVLQKLLEMGIQKVDPKVQRMLPTWSEVTNLYGSTPVIVGSESCRRFNVPLDHRYIGVAGTYNSGTNALTYYMRANLIIPGNERNHFRGVLSQVPWHKHTLLREKYQEVAPVHKDIPKDDVLPIAIIRDPFTWAQSMCASPYDVNFTKSDRCPSFVDSPVEYNNVKYDSILHLWNDYYRQYLQSTSPRLIVRFEDLLFHSKEVVHAIKDCSGAEFKEDAFYYVVGQSKWEHVKDLGPQSTLISAMIKHTDARRRVRNLTRQDIDAAAAILDKDLLQSFGYRLPEQSQIHW